MSKKQLAKRVSALSMAAALSVSAVAWDLVPSFVKNPGTVSYAVTNTGNADSVSRDEIKKSEYPAFLELVTQSDGEEGFTITIDKFDAVSSFFDVTLIVPDEDEPDGVKRYIMGEEGFNVPAGEYEIEISSISENNPYDLSEFSDGKTIINVNTDNLNACRCVLPNGELFYFTDSSEIRIPVDYDTIALESIGEDESVNISAPEGIYTYTADELAMNSGLYTAAELRQGNVPVSEDYSVERFTEKEDTPYFYGEKLLIKPDCASVKISSSEGELDIVAPEIITVGEQEIIGSHKFTVTVWHGEKEKKDIPMEGFVVKDTGDKFIVKIDPDGGGAPNSSYIIYQADEKHHWGRNMPQSGTNGEFVIDKSTMTGDMYFAVVLTNITSHTLEYASDCGVVSLIENYSYLKVTPGKYYTVTDGDVYYIDDDAANTKVVLELDQDRTDSANDGSLYFRIDTNHIHSKKSFKVDFKMELEIDLLELLADSSTKQLSDGIAECKVNGYYLNNDRTLRESEINAFDMTTQWGAQLQVNILQPTEWVVKEVVYNDHRNGDGSGKISYNESALAQPERAMPIDIFFDKFAYTQDVRIVFAPRAYTQTVAAEGNGSADIANGTDGSLGYGDHAKISAVPSVGSYVSVIMKRAGANKEYIPIFEDGVSVSDDSSLEVREDGSVIFTDGDAISGPNQYRVIFAEAESNKYERTFDLLVPDNKPTLWNQSEKSDGLDYSISYLAEKYSVTYDRAELFEGRNVRMSAFSQEYSFVDSDTASYELEGEFADKIIDEPVYFLDMETGIITCDDLKFHIVVPDIVIDSDSVTNNSALRYLTFGIFGKDETTVTIKAEDKSPVPLTIDEIVLWDIDENEAEIESRDNTIVYKFDPRNKSVTKKDVSIKISTAEGHTEEYIVRKDGSEWTLAPAAGDEYNDIYMEAVPPEITLTAADPEAAETDILRALDEAKSGGTAGFYPDNKADIGRFNAYVDENNAYWVNRAFNFDVKVKDASGVMSADISVDGSRTQGSIDYNSEDMGSVEEAKYSETIPVSGDGAHTVSVRAEDLPGNTADTVTRTVSIDSKAPELVSIKAFVINDNGSRADYYGQWTNKPVELVVTVRDEGSGVMQVLPDHWDGIIKNEQTLNLTKENSSGNKPHYEKIYTYRINPSANETYVFTAKDNVGNEKELGKYTVKTENIPPAITGFSFDRSTKSPFSNDSEDDNAFSAGGDLDGYYPVATDRYGYYFKDDTIVSVRVNDLRGGDKLNSRISRMEYALVDSETISNNNGVLSGELIDNAPKYNISNVNDPKFTVRAFWKGQVVVRAFDNAGNCSGWLTPDGLILESEAQHDSENHISVTMPSSDHGSELYDSSITIPISVQDKAGIRSVSWSLVSETGQVIRQGGCTVENGNIIDFGGDSLQWSVPDGGTDRDNVTNMNAQLQVGEQRNNMTLHISMTCNSDHSSSFAASFSIDSTAPKIGEVIMSGTPVQKNGKTYFNTARTATINVYERNLDQASLSKAVEVLIAGQTGNAAGSYTLSNWTFDSSTKSDTDAEGANRWTATLTLNADAEYSSIKFNVADTLGHTASGSAPGGFIIDRTSPVISGGFDNNDVRNEKYYNASRKAIVKINEHNFIPQDVVVGIRAYGEDNITSADTMKIDAAMWKQSQINPDEWSAEFPFDRDGRYSISVDYTDPANNRGNGFASGDFYIDTNPPSISQTFTGRGSDKFATNGKYDPTVTFSDYNLPDETMISGMCKVEISKMEADGTTYNKSRVTSKTYTLPEKGAAGEYETVHSIFSDEVETDGIYKIKITAEDLAGNASKPLELTVSVNRYGATYEVINSDAVIAVKKFKDGIPINYNTDVVIREINATQPSGESTVTVVKNGAEIITLGTKDYEIQEQRSAGESGWYENIYTIKQSNFSSDGDYLVNIESGDEAGNLNSNNTPVYADRKCTVEFSVDKTAPEVIIAGVEDGAVLKDSEIQLRITCSDQNLKALSELSDEELVLNVNGNDYTLGDLGVLNASVSNDEAGNIIMELPVKSDGKKSVERLVVTVKDKAGNFSDGDNSAIEFTLSASFWDLHKGLVIGGGSAGVLGIAALAVLAMKKRRNG